MTTAIRTGFVAFVACLTLVVPETASAAPILYARAHAVAQNQDVVGAPIDSEDTGFLNGFDSAPLVDAAIGSSSSFASVTDGVMSAYASAGSLANGINGQAAFGEALFADTLTLMSNTLAVGTSVTLHFALDLDATSTAASISGVQTACGGAHANLSVYVLGGTSTVASAVDSSCAGDTNLNTGSFLVYEIGDTVTVAAILTAHASARAGSSAYVDASHTLRLLIDPTTNDFFYSTLSGNSYLSAATPAAVPEPASLLLLGSGIAGMAAKVRKRRKQQVQ
jgi:hypothetical protein